MHCFVNLQKIKFSFLKDNLCNCFHKCWLIPFSFKKVFTQYSKEPQFVATEFVNSDYTLNDYLNT